MKSRYTNLQIICDNEEIKRLNKKAMNKLEEKEKQTITK